MVFLNSYKKVIEFCLLSTNTHYTFLKFSVSICQMKTEKKERGLNSRNGNTRNVYVTFHLTKIFYYIPNPELSPQKV